MSYETKICCDLCGAEVRRNSSDHDTEVNKSYDLILTSDNYEDDYQDIRIDICADCEPIMRESLSNLIAELIIK